MPPKPIFEELDFEKTDPGDLIPRRRMILSLGNTEICEGSEGRATFLPLVSWARNQSTSFCQKSGNIACPREDRKMQPTSSGTAPRTSV